MVGERRVDESTLSQTHHSVLVSLSYKIKILFQRVAAEFSIKNHTYHSLPD